MQGETVIVKQVYEYISDAHNNQVPRYQELEVENVLVAPQQSDSLIDSTRPHGWYVKYTLYFPKTWQEPLEGSRIQVRGQWFDVLGDPDCFDLDDCPTSWNRVVNVGVAHG